MLDVYAIPVSLYCAKLRIVLRHKGLQWRELPPPGGYGSDAYKDVVPSGNLPALVDGDLLIADSDAIGEYLEEAHPKPPLLPQGIAARAKVRERSRFHDTRLEPELRRVFPHLPGRIAAPPGFLQAQSAALSARLEQFERMLTSTPDTGQSLTLGDCGYPITFAWIEALASRLPLGIRWPGGVRTYRERLEACPAVADELADYTPRLAEFLGR